MRAKDLLPFGKAFLLGWHAVVCGQLLPDL